jgi:octaprenyl-diphosphate synthase
VDGHPCGGKAVAYLKWGNSIAVLVGIFCSPGAVRFRRYSAAPDRSDSGGADRTDVPGRGPPAHAQRDIHLAEGEYLEVIRRKTAVLFETACRVSAVLANAPEEQESALASYGVNLGMAFQIADDLFDYALATPQFGKDVGADLREGKMTLPLIHGLRQVRAEDREWMVSVIQDPHFSTEDFRKLAGLLHTSGAARYAEQTAEKYILNAKAALSVFPHSETLGTLIDIADYALHRQV